MPFHKDQMFTDAALEASGNSSDLLVGPGEYDISAIVRGLTAEETLDIDVYESADDSTYVKLANFKQIAADGEYHRKVQTRLEYLRLVYTLSGGAVTKLRAGLTFGADGAAQTVIS